MRALLARHGFQVVRDEDLPTSTKRFAPRSRKLCGASSTCEW
jgi:hypothetical protein